MTPPEMRRLKQLEDENAKLRKLVADLSLDREMLQAVGFPPAANPRVFICGPTPLVESAGRLLRDIGHEPASIKTERFGPTGGPP